MFRVGGWLFLLAAVLVGCFGYASYVGLVSILGIKPTGCESLTQAPAWIEPPKENLSSQAGEALALEMIQQGRYRSAYSQLNHLYASSADPEIKAKALFLQGVVALQHLNLTDRALCYFQTLLDSFPQGLNSAQAHYYLGWIYFEKKDDLKNAITHLTAAIEDYPHSPITPTAEFLVQKAAARLAQEGERVGLVRASILGAWFPNNRISLLLSFLGLLATLGVPALWILSQYQKPLIPADKASSASQVLAGVMRDPVLRPLMIGVILCAALSFFITQYQSHLVYQELSESLKRVGINVEAEK